MVAAGQGWDGVPCSLACLWGFCTSSTGWLGGTVNRGLVQKRHPAVRARPLPAALSKKEAAVRSSTVALDVLPGQPVTLSIEAPGLRDQLTATNGQVLLLAR